MTTTKTKPHKTRRLLLECYHFLTWRVFFPLIYDSLLKDVCLPVLNLIPHQLGSLGPLVLLQFRSNVTFELHVSLQAPWASMRSRQPPPPLSSVQKAACPTGSASCLPGQASPTHWASALLQAFPPQLQASRSLGLLSAFVLFFFLKRLGLLSSCTGLLPPLTQALSGCKLGF